MGPVKLSAMADTVGTPGSVSVGLECSQHKGQQRELSFDSTSGGLIAGCVAWMSPGTVP